jgi:carbonic anhydrase
MIINHTDCGMLTFKDEDLLTKLEQSSETSTVAPAHFYTFSDLKSNVQRQIQKVKSHPWIPEQIPVRGFIFDVKTGELSEVSL